MNPSYREEELRHVIADSKAVLVVEVGTDGSGPASVGAAVAADLGLPYRNRADVEAWDGGDHVTDRSLIALPGLHGADIALIIYTSGTTGRSKGCAHTVDGLRAGILALMEAWGVTDDDVVVHALPLFHVHGLCVALMGALLTGAQTMFLPRFEPALVVDAVRAGGTVFMSVPTMVHRLLGHLEAHPDDGAVLGQLRLMTCGSAALPAEQLERFRDATGLTILERYGMSETLITVSNPLDGPRIPGAVGRPIGGVEARVVDDELWIAAAGMMRGYWGRPDADADAFVVDEHDPGKRWFKTGDAVTIDDDGVIRIVGRLSQDIMKVGGFKLSTREVEEALLGLPSVAEVAVVGVADVEWGERVSAMIVPRDPMHPPTLEDLQVIALAPVKKPRDLRIVSSLPRNALGKVMKPLVRAAFEAS